MTEPDTLFSFPRSGTWYDPSFPSPETVHQAVIDGEFRPWFQPVVYAGSGTLCGCEVLVRWESPVAGIIPPSAFIEWLEGSGLIVPVTTRLMQQVADTLVPVSRQLPQGFRVGINLCAGNLLSASLERACDAFQKQPCLQHVELLMELTERLPFPVPAEVKPVFSRLSRKNVHFALDDFCTGWSTYECLRHMPVNVLKVDRHFVRDFLTDEVADSIIDSMVYLADRLKLDIVAEGVETGEQAARLFCKGIKYLQGYYFSPPLSRSDFIRKWITPQGRNVFAVP
ncbi:EAL domain-containing protein [Escherichia coli]|uniref:EAL domain-containing protein n=1 Tax=Escherichia coli TaxID=562 RepID=UPI0012FF9114|nr:EAL domain-containing protein [Escherichia coli]